MIHPGKAARVGGLSLFPEADLVKSKVLAGALTLAVVATGVSPALASASGGDALDAVNTFIGTQDEGNTFPGASAPFGMIAGQPHHRRTTPATATATPRSAASATSSCPAPAAGSRAGWSRCCRRPGNGPGRRFRHRPAGHLRLEAVPAPIHPRRRSRPGRLLQGPADQLRRHHVEATALTRARAERYTFAQAHANDGHVCSTWARPTSKPTGGRQQVRVVDDRSVEGNGGQPQRSAAAPRLHDVVPTKFDQPLRRHGIVDDRGGGRAPGVRARGRSRPHGVWLTFD